MSDERTRELAVTVARGLSMIAAGLKRWAGVGSDAPATPHRSARTSECARHAGGDRCGILARDRDEESSAP